MKEDRDQRHFFKDLGPPRQRSHVRLPRPRARCGACARGLTDDAARSAVEYAVGADEGSLW
jgi:hypothetical protein